MTADNTPEQQTRRFQRILLKARTTAEATGLYSSTDTRELIVTEFKRRCGGKTPYDWQLDTAEALILKMDCIVIAGTGAGKTMPFVMPLFADKTGQMIIIIVSPLNMLQEDQTNRFRVIDLTATPVNSATWDDKLRQDILDHKYQVLLVGPEMLLGDTFGKLMRKPSFTRNIAAIVIDEAHCISQWGHSFRKDYGELRKLRSFVALNVPFLATSATLTPAVLGDVQLQLGFSMERTFLLNLGNDRPNITPLVCLMKGAANDLEALDFSVDEALHDEELVPTIIYVKTRDGVQQVCEYLQQQVPERYRVQIDFIHAMRSPRAKAFVMQRFCEGVIKILIATEVAGMGLDVKGLVRTIEFMVPGSLAEYIQHHGRAGRGGEPSVAVLLVEPSVFQRVRKRAKGKRGKAQIEAPLVPSDPPARSHKRSHAAIDSDSDDEPTSDSDSTDSNIDNQVEDDGREYKKKIEEGMRNWIEAKRCRREVSDTYFKNPRRTQALTVPCCDLCILRKAKDLSADMTVQELELYGLLGRLDIRDPYGDQPDENPAPAKKRSRKRGEGNRTTTRLVSCRDALLSWRRWRWLKDYRHCTWGPEVLLPDKWLEVLAKGAHIRTVAHMKLVLPDWDFADDYGEEILDHMRPFDEAWKADCKEKADANKAKKSKVTQATKVIREEARREEKRAAAASSVPVQLSHGLQLPVASSSHNQLLPPSASGLPVPAPQGYYYYPNPPPPSPYYHPLPYPPPPLPVLSPAYHFGAYPPGYAGPGYAGWPPA